MLTFERVSKHQWTFSIDGEIVGEAMKPISYTSKYWRIDIFELDNNYFWADNLTVMKAFVKVWFAKEPEGE